MSSPLVAGCPKTLAKIVLPYLQRADELDASKQLFPAYFLRTYVAQLVLQNRNPSDADQKKFLVDLLNELEAFKKQHPETGDMDGRTVVTRLALTLFARADEAERNATCSPAVCKMFFMASILFESTKQFNDNKMDTIAAEKNKYARFIAARMTKCLKEDSTYEPYKKEEAEAVKAARIAGEEAAASAGATAGADGGAAPAAAVSSGSGEPSTSTAAAASSSANVPPPPQYQQPPPHQQPAALPLPDGVPPPPPALTSGVPETASLQALLPKLPTTPAPGGQHQQQPPAAAPPPPPPPVPAPHVDPAASPSCKDAFPTAPGPRLVPEEPVYQHPHPGPVSPMAGAEPSDQSSSSQPPPAVAHEKAPWRLPPPPPKGVTLATLLADRQPVVTSAAQSVAGGETAVLNMMEAQSRAKQAVSALQFTDAEAAKQKLREALALLDSIPSQQKK